MHDPHQLLPVAYHAAAKVVRNQLLAEEAGERAVYQLTLAMLSGTPPLHPKAWLRVVARRSAWALLRSDWARTSSMSHEDCTQQPAPYQLPRRVEADRVRETAAQWLSPRQHEAFEAALTSNSSRAAARNCGMQPRDYRRQLGRIARKAKAALARYERVDPFADDPAVQFRLPS